MRPLFYLLLALGWFSVAPAFSNAEQSLVLTGSSTLAPLAAEIGKRFETKNPALRVDVQTGGSSRGIADVRRGLADIGMSSRALYPEEKAHVSTHVVALDGVAFVIHRENPVQALTKQQAIGIFSGEIKNWKEVGGSDGEITVVNRPKGRSELDLVTEFLGIKPQQIKPDVIAGENQQCVKIISGNKNAIVYLSVGTAEYEAERGTPLKLLALDGIPASSATVRTKKYPLVRPLVLITQKDMTPITASFLEFALSSSVNDLIREQAFVPVH